MRIGFNGHRLAGQRLGVGRYIEYMLRYWSSMLSESEEVVLFLRRPLDATSLAYLQLSPAIRPTVLRPDMSGIAWENLRLRGQAPSLDVLFCPAYTAPVGYRGRLVVATHSVNEIEPGAHSRWYRQTYGRLYRHSARQADAVIVPAETTRRDVGSLLGVAPERIFVVRQGTEESFAPMQKEEEALRAVRRRFFGGDRPYILFVGKCSGRRNIPVLLEAFAHLRRTERIPHGLLLFGPNTAELPLARLCSELGIRDSVVQTDGALTDHRDLVPIYNAADVFVHPSAYEGWSMTTLEALACGTAVVAANRGGLAEAVAGHGLMLDELTPESFADAIGRVLRDDDLRRDLQSRAVERGSAIRWEQTTSQTLEVLRTVATR